MAYLTNEQKEVAAKEINNLYNILKDEFPLLRVDDRWGRINGLTTEDYDFAVEVVPVNGQLRLNFKHWIVLDLERNARVGFKNVEKIRNYLEQAFLLAERRKKNAAGRESAKSAVETILENNGVDADITHGGATHNGEYVTYYTAEFTKDGNRYNIRVYANDTGNVEVAKYTTLGVEEIVL